MMIICGRSYEASKGISVAGGTASTEPGFACGAVHVEQDSQRVCDLEICCICAERTKVRRR